MVKKCTQPDLLPKEEFSALLDLSARLGCNPDLVQANNGNLSLKVDGVLWVKASGKWLSNANEEEIFVPIELAVVHESMRRNVEIAQVCGPASVLRPSIESATHAVLPHRVVLHVHSVNVIAWAVREDAPHQLSRRLDGLRWRWIPYVASGIPLAREIERALHDAPESNVFILGNHGLVVCGSDCECTEQLLQEVERRLAITPRQAAEPMPALLTVAFRSSQWRFPELQELHALGTDPISRTILRKGVLYPCQAIFLGANLPMLPCSIPLSRFAEHFNGAAETLCYAVVEGGGVVVNEKITKAECETLKGLLRVVQRIEASAPLRYLTKAEIAAVLGTGSQGYRETGLAAGSAPGNAMH
jgi:rhamnose utilization protein RhaD (predicted bifunctional aldolase and dehydrogenase)